MKIGSLVIAGLGIKLISHTTHETQLAIGDAEKIFYVSCHSYMDAYLQKINPSAESLNYLYDKMPNREATYIAMKNKVVSAVINEKQKVCWVFYGHPCVFVMPGRLAINELEALGYPCAALPAVSALDCIFSDLLIDATLGYACFEATELVIHQRKLDVSTYVILWQPAMFYNPSTIGSQSPDKEEHIFHRFTDYLLKFYPPKQTVIIYSAAMYPGQKFLAKKMQLIQLKRSDLTLECTLILPPNENL